MHSCCTHGISSSHNTGHDTKSLQQSHVQLFYSSQHQPGRHTARMCSNKCVCVAGWACLVMHQSGRGAALESARGFACFAVGA